jgi:hypothetical protein
MRAATTIEWKGEAEVIHLPRLQKEIYVYL